MEDLLESDTARKMLSNCNFIQMLNQAPNDRLQLMQLLNLSESQADVITAAPRGQGLIYTGTNCVPFASSFPKTTKDGGVHPIYRVLTSNMKEIHELLHKAAEASKGAQFCRCRIVRISPKGQEDPLKLFMCLIIAVDRYFHNEALCIRFSSLLCHDGEHGAYHPGT